MAYDLDGLLRCRCAREIQSKTAMGNFRETREGLVIDSETDPLIFEGWEPEAYSEGQAPEPTEEGDSNYDL